MLGAIVGVNYGTLGDNLPSPNEVLELCKSNGITNIRIFEPNTDILKALSEKPSFSVIIGVRNQNIQSIANDYNAAKSWVQNNVAQYSNKVNFRYIAVGNEITPYDPSTGSFAPFVGPAMVNIHKALRETALNNNVPVSTALRAAVLRTSYPPSAGAFKPKFAPFINPIIQFLQENQAPLLVNVYPYFVYISNPKDISLDYALFRSDAPVVKDGQYEYKNLFSAIVDAFSVATGAAGGPNVDIVVTETGWPSDGGTATSMENAQTYNNNLVNFVRNGTPRKPGKPIETYIFDVIDENQKSPEVEKHWGVFLPSKQPKYPISFI
ncbi:glucan endo-1,3-beta-glucosidase-like [Andrographis paniculata]|uniref:glucan endo-1,3-beta-glucosidase-like n=1 Tax=Andrographis paniculata TaxID=175694 RepID=UPI0021E94159|nr:glucan endo-1,3-beta-glucosidase-like [Andrographis paniculata]